jgi:protein-tyrosine phosphatase
MFNKASSDPNANAVLFLCSGNFYRSRFAEELFNATASSHGIPWEADSAGLDLNPNNKGPVPGLVLDRIESLNIKPMQAKRFSRPADSSDLACAEVIIAMSRDEHYGLMHKKFPTFVFKTKFWDVGDTDEMASAKAFAEMERQVGNLVEELQKGNTDLVRTD